MAITDLKKVQSGQEVAWGTTLAATGKWMGVTDVTLTAVDPIYHLEKSGFMRPSAQTALVDSSAEGTVEMDLSYEDIVYPLDNFFSQCTPAASVWTYTPPTTAITTPNFYTLEIGGTDFAYEACGVLFNDITISGEAAGIWHGSFGFVAKDIHAEALTALTDRTVEMIRMADTAIHFDVWGTAAGTAAASAATLISFELNITNGKHLKTFAGGLQPAAWGETQWGGQLTIVCEFNAVAKAIVDALLAATPAMQQRAIRIAATSGGKYARLDFYGTLIDGVELFGDRDGNVTVELVWAGTWEPTVSDWLEIIIDNDFAGPLV